MSGPAAWLRDRAKSYARDAELLRSNGDTDDALVFEAIRDELRKCADEWLDQRLAANVAAGEDELATSTGVPLDEVLMRRHHA